MYRRHSRLTHAAKQFQDDNNAEAAPTPLGTALGY